MIPKWIDNKILRWNDKWYQGELTIWYPCDSWRASCLIENEFQSLLILKESKAGTFCKMFPILKWLLGISACWDSRKDVQHSGKFIWDFEFGPSRVSCLLFALHDSRKEITTTREFRSTGKPNKCAFNCNSCKYHRSILSASILNLNISNEASRLLNTCIL